MKTFSATLLAVLTCAQAMPSAALELCYCKSKDVTQACKTLCEANPGQDVIGRSVPPPKGPIIDPFSKHAIEAQLKDRAVKEQAIRGAPAAR